MRKEWLQSLKNLLHLSGASLILRAGDFARSAIIAQHLPVRFFGLYWSARVTVSLVELIVDFGLNARLVQRIAGGGAEGLQDFEDVLGLRLALAVVLLAAGGATMILLPLTATTRLVTILIGLSLLPNAITSTIQGVLNAQSRLRPYLWSTLLLNAIMIPGTWVAVRYWGIGGVAGGLLVQAALLAVLLLYFCRLESVPMTITLFVSIARWLKLIRAGFPFFLLSVQTLLYWRVDTLLLSLIRGSRDVGYYAVAYRFIDGVLVLPPLVNAAVLPMLSRFAENDDRARLVNAASTVAGCTMAVAVCAAFVLKIVATPLIIWLFGEAYRQASVILFVLMWTAVFTFVNSPLSLVFYALGRPDRILGIPGILTLSNILCNLVLIPWRGAVGAAIATLITEALGFALLLGAVRKAGMHVPVLSLGAALGKSIIAGILGLAVVARIGFLPLQVVALVLVFGSTYLALCFLRSEDRQSAKAALQAGISCLRPVP